MAVDYNKLLKPTETLASSLPIMIETFVSFYGEANRPRIEDKFNNMLLIGYHSTNSINYILNHIYDETQRDLISEFVQKHNLTAEQKAILDDINLSSEETPDFLKDNDIAFQELKNRFQALQNQYHDYHEYNSRMEEFDDKLTTKYNQKLLADFTSLLPEEYKDRVKETHEWQNLVGDILEGIGLIDFFSAEMSERLSDRLTPPSQKNNIIHARISYFQTLGFDYGEDYEAYISDSRCQKLIPDQNVINLIEDKRDKYFFAKEKEASLLTFDYQSIRNQIDAEDLLFKKDGYDYELISDPCNCIYTNVKKVRGEYRDYPIIYISMTQLPEGNGSLDETLIHELNHRFEMDLLVIDENGFTTKNGWEEIYDGFSVDDEAYREYELLNEAINELIAQDITKKMHELGLYIFDTEGTVVRETSDYAAVNFIVRDFYNKYKDDIIKSRTDIGGIEHIKGKVGADNLDALNDLVNKYQNETNDTNSLLAGETKLEQADENAIAFKQAANMILADMDAYKAGQDTSVLKA